MLICIITVTFTAGVLNDHISHHFHHHPIICRHHQGHQSPSNLLHPPPYHRHHSPRSDSEGGNMLVTSHPVIKSIQKVHISRLIEEHIQVSLDIMKLHKLRLSNQFSFVYGALWYQNSSVLCMVHCDIRTVQFCVWCRVISEQFSFVYGAGWYQNSSVLCMEKHIWTVQNLQCNIRLPYVTPGSKTG